MGLRRMARAADAVVVALLAGSAQAQVWSRDPAEWDGGPAVHAALAAVITLPLLARRRQPLLVLCVVVVAAWLQGELGAGLGQPWLAVVLALYAVGAHASLRPAVLGAAAVGAFSAVDSVDKLRAGEPWDEVVPAWFVLAGIWGFGRWMRRRRHEVGELNRRAALLERDREEAATAAVAHERARIARELHDLVAHSMGVIVIQSQAAHRVLRSEPDAAERALEAITTTGRQGMAEMRRLLGMLVAGDDTAPLAPAPTLRHLDTLVEQVRGAGLPVTVSIDGTQRPLPPGVDLSAYRIVQEALTNTLRHAGAAHARVHLRYTVDAVEVEVCDDGAGRVGDGGDGGVDGADGVDGVAGAGAGGHGLVGMRERVALYGGTLRAGAGAEGGFVVRARLPSDPAAVGP